ncbi:MAG: type III pantothenate kinase [Eubacterium sp.]|nr:type III pantothenate kinase [Eubacterium sp.]
MILAVDAGNTNIVAALMNNGNVINEYRYNTGKDKDFEYHKNHLERLVQNRTIDSVIISSVVPEINSRLDTVCVQLTGISPKFVSCDMATGLDIKYDNPQKLGADLICAAVGAVKKYGAPVIVMDIGTATTFSVINKNKEYLGGMIAPGPYTSMQALASMASQLSETELEITDNVIGTNTAECIKIGTLTAHSAMLDGMLDRVIPTLDTADVKLVATGGFAQKITSMCTHKIICDVHLIFTGLYELYKINYCLL